MAQKISYVVGGILVALGVIGFFNDPILGVFEVDAVHSIILVVAGLVLVGTAAAGGAMASMWTKVVGGVIAIVAILGYIPPVDTVVGIADTNLASSMLQTVVAAVLLWAGFSGNTAPQAAAPTSQPQQPMAEAPGAPMDAPAMPNEDGADENRTV